MVAQPHKIGIDGVRIENGRVWFTVVGIPCWELQIAYSPGGPWFHAGYGVDGQPVCIAPNEMTPSPQFFRAIETKCVDDIPIDTKEFRELKAACDKWAGFGHPWPKMSVGAKRLWRKVFTA